MPTVSELTPVPGNAGLSAEPTEPRACRDVFRSLSRARSSAEFDRAPARRRPTALVAHAQLHPGRSRASRVHGNAGVLYNRDPRFAAYC